jgi:imidazolonepropionase-like amidohydrolase
MKDSKSKKYIYFVVFLIVAILLSVGVWVQVVSPWRAERCTLIRSTKIFDGIQKTYLMDQDILIEQGQVVSIQKRSRPRFFCQVIELYSSVVLPGLIDSHTHLMLHSSPAQFDTQEIILGSMNMNQKQRLEAGKVNAFEVLKSGFTLVRDLGNSGQFIDDLLRDYIQKHSNRGPEIIMSGPGLAGPPTAQLPSSARGVQAEYRIIQNSQEIDAAIAENLAHKAEWLKVYADNEPGEGGVSPQLFNEAVRKGHEHGLKVAAHTTNSQSAQMSIQAGVDSLEHLFSVPDGELEMPPAPVYFVITDFNRADCERAQKITAASDYKDCGALTGLRAKRTKWALDHHLIPIFGSDSYADFGFTRGNSALKALEALSEQGLTPFQTLQAAGILAAQMLGRPDRGQIAPGVPADIIALAGDPLSSISDLKNIHFVMKGGMVICDSQKSCNGKKELIP